MCCQLTVNMLCLRLFQLNKLKKRWFKAKEIETSVILKESYDSESPNSFFICLYAVKGS